MHVKPLTLITIGEHHLNNSILGYFKKVVPKHPMNPMVPNHLQDFSEHLPYAKSWASALQSVRPLTVEMSSHIFRHICLTFPLPSGPYLSYIPNLYSVVQTPRSQIWVGSKLRSDRKFASCNFAIDETCFERQKHLHRQRAKNTSFPLSECSVHVIELLARNATLLGTR